MTTDERDRSAACAGHRDCLFCGERNPRSLGLCFQAADNGGVQAMFTAPDELQGYAGILHGGIIASVLDAAMTHCLFFCGVQAVTGDLHVRYRHEVPCGVALCIQARVLSSRPPLYILRAELLLENRVMARAEARFMQRRVSV